MWKRFLSRIIVTIVKVAKKKEKETKRMGMILVKDEVLAKPDKTRVKGYILVRNYEEQPTKG